MRFIIERKPSDYFSVFTYCLIAIFALILLDLNTSSGQQPENRWRIGDKSRQPKVTVVVGSLLHSEGGPKKKSTQLLFPSAIDFDRKGNMVIVERIGGRVHRLAPDGKLTQIAGDGSRSYEGDGGLAKHATFNLMQSVLVDTEDNIYIADSANNVVRKIEKTSNMISTFAGTGQIGFSGDGGRANVAKFDLISSIAFNPEKDEMYLVDLKNIRVRMINMHSRIVRTIAGTGIEGVPFHAAKAVQTNLLNPHAVALDANENIYLIEPKGHSLRRITLGKIYTVAGTGESGYKDGHALESQFATPTDVCIDDQGRVFIADDLNNAIRMYDPKTERVTTLLGKGQGVPAVTLKRPQGICFENGTLYVVDSGNHRILRLD